MAMLEKHRSSIYRSLVPILGEEEAEAMVSQFPAGDGDEMVTRSFLRAELSEVRLEVGGLRTEVHVLANRTIVWMVGTMVAVGGLIVAAIGVLG